MLLMVCQLKKKTNFGNANPCNKSRKWNHNGNFNQIYFDKIVQASRRYGDKGKNCWDWKQKQTKIDFIEKFMSDHKFFHN